MKKQINLNNLKTIDETIATLPKTYHSARCASSWSFLRFLGPIGSFFLHRDIIAPKTFICKQDAHILEYSVQPQCKLSSPTMEYEIMQPIDVTSDYEIVDELNIATAPDHTL